MNVQLNVHPRSKINKAAFLKLASGANLELFKYEAPDQMKEQPKNSDFGGHHIALYVDNMDEAAEYLESKGMQIIGEPMTMTEGPNAGVIWGYFLSPWGLQLELVSYENSQAYEKNTSNRVFPIKLN
jgi:catechol 2,3-dioxygenase-like lactoylglutathione lyase family enzyme